MLVLVGLGAQVACSRNGDWAVERRTSGIIGGTPVSVDPAGFAFVSNGAVEASGMFLAPGWVLTAGHFIADWDDARRTSFGSPPIVSAAFGTTSDGSQGTPFVHPNWWGALGAPPPPLGTMDPSYDVGLIHLTSPADGSSYPNKLYNQISNDWPGWTVRCYGYGKTNLDGTGGGMGMLQTADFDVTGDELKPLGDGGIEHPHPGSSLPMFTVADSASGQRLFHGDSGGTCMSVDRSPYVISGIAQSYLDHPDGTHTTYLVDPYYVRDWVDKTMHSPVETIPTSSPGAPVAFTSASTKTGLIRRNYVVATLAGFVPYLNQNGLGGWSGWFPLSQIPPTPFLSGYTHGSVGLTVALDGASEPHVWMAVAVKPPTAPPGLQAPQVMWVSANVVLGTRPPWPTFTWNDAGSPPANRVFLGNPAIVTPGALGTDRVDYFAYASDPTFGAFGNIYTRWMFNGAWQDSGWAPLPAIPGVTIKSSPSVALQGSTYYVAARGSDDQIWITTLPNVTNSNSYGGPWTDWFPLSGQYLGPPAITAWDRGVDVYGIGYDNYLYHQSMDADGVWSGYVQLGVTFTNTAALTASNYLPSTHEIAVVGMVSGPPSSPRITRFPW
jgi:hypothetical protein